MRHANPDLGRRSCQLWALRPLVAAWRPRRRSLPQRGGAARSGGGGGGGEHPPAVLAAHSGAALSHAAGKRVVARIHHDWTRLSGRELAEHVRKNIPADAGMP
jgi:hypothetical protein